MRRCLQQKRLCNGVTTFVFGVGVQRFPLFDLVLCNMICAHSVPVLHRTLGKTCIYLQSLCRKIYKSFSCLSLFGAIHFVLLRCVQFGHSGYSVMEGTFLSNELLSGFIAEAAEQDEDQIQNPANTEKA